MDDIQNLLLDLDKAIEVRKLALTFIKVTARTNPQLLDETTLRKAGMGYLGDYSIGQLKTAILHIRNATISNPSQTAL